MFGRPTRRSGSGREANSEDQEGSGGPPGGLGGVEMPIQRSGRSREAHPEVRK